MKQLTIWLIIILLCSISFNAEAKKKKKKPRFKPYYSVTTEASEFQKAVTDTRLTINNSQFKLVGDYSPYENAHIFVLTNDAMLDAASKSDFGGYGAVIRMSVTATDNGVQVSYVNPTYMTSLYHLPEVPDVSAELEKTFGKGEPAGSKKGKTKRQLKNYQYMIFLPEFEDHDKLGSFGSHQQALDAVNGNLSSGKYKLGKVFEIAIPGKEEVLIGVTIGDGDGADTLIMPLIDKGEFKHTAHLPYAVLVSGDTVYSQAGKFRIASSFPDLTMGTFMDISDAPDGIKNSLQQLATSP